MTHLNLTVVYFQICATSLTSSSPVDHNNYTETMKRSHMDGGNNGAQKLLPLCMLYYSPAAPLVYVNKPKVIVTNLVFTFVH